MVFVLLFKGEENVLNELFVNIVLIINGKERFVEFVSDMLSGIKIFYVF